jgi:hypothetical protein
MVVYPTVGNIYVMTLTGTTTGFVYGTNIYTNDSSLAAAAVHSGTLANGQTGAVYVEILAGQSSYTGTTQNGVTSYSWGSWPSSYQFVTVPVPTVSSVSPSSGSTSGGTTITVTGSDLWGATSITVGANACTGLTVTSLTSATCTTPAGTAGTDSVVVTTSGGTNGANTLFTYVTPAPPTPSITSITPVTQGLRVAFDTGTVASASSSVTIASVNYTAACTSTNGGVSGSTAGPASPITVNNLTGGKSYTCTVSASDTGGTSTSAASAAAIPLAPPTPQAIPTLSEWTQIVMMLAMIATAGFYGWRMKQR